MSSSPFDQAATLIATVQSHVAQLTTTRIHPGQGMTADQADADAQSVAQSAIQLEDWLRDAEILAQSQADADHGLSAAPKPADLEAWHKRISGGLITDPATREAETHLWLEAAKARRAALDAHTAATFTDVPALPTAPDVCSTSTADPTGGKTKQGSDGAETDPDEEKTEQGADGAATDEPETPPSEAVSTSPTPMTTATTETPTPMTTADTAARTELSSSSMTSDPATRAALSGQVPGGQGTPQVSASQPAMATGAPGVSQQLSPPAQSGSRTPTPRSPEKRREEADRQADRDAVHTAAATVTATGAGAVAGAGMSPAHGASAPSPTTAPSGSPAAPTAAPSTPPQTPAQGAGGGVGAPGAGMGRGGATTLGSGTTVKPVVAAEQPYTPAEQRLLDEYDKKGDKK